MKIAIIQHTIEEQFEQTFSNVKKLINQCGKADVILLPELWNTIYTNKAIVQSSTHWQECLEYMKQVSKEFHCTIIGGSLATPEKDKLANTSFFIQNGEIKGMVQKMHLMEFHGRSTYQEKDVFYPGHQLFTSHIGKAKIGIVICYDLRFPELARLLSKKGIDILFVPAAFNKEVGQAHWDALLKTRAMENQIFICAANPAQKEYPTYTSYGHSCIVNPFGLIQEKLDEKEGILFGNIDLHEIEKIRTRMPFWNIRREDIYDIIEKESVHFKD